MKNLPVVVRAVMAPMLVIGGLAVTALPAVAQDAALVGVDEVLQEPLAQTVPVIGRFIARQGGPVATQAGGRVTKINAHVGDRVAAGDVLAELDLDRLSWQRDLAKAAYAASDARLGAAQARLTKKKQELARIEGIQTSAAFSQARYEDVQQELIEAEEAVSEAASAKVQAQAELKLAQDDFEKGRVAAPYNGVVTAKHTEVGSYLRVGDPVASLVNVGALEIEADVPYERIAGLKVGTTLPVSLPDGTQQSAKVRAVGGEEDPLTRTRVVRLSPQIENPIVPLADGMSATIFVPAGIPRNVVTVDKDAVIKRQGMSLVYIVQDGTAQIRPIELGEAVGDRFEVRSGLQPGDVVVNRGNERLRPGQAVKPGAAPEGEGEGNS